MQDRVVMSEIDTCRYGRREVSRYVLYEKLSSKTWTSAVIGSTGPTKGEGHVK